LPRLRAFSVENFKSIRSKTRIELRPLTLLFGPNNGGKSTLLHSLLYAADVFETGTLDVHRPRLSRNTLDFGGLRNVIHARDPSHELVLGFELDVTSKDLSLPGMSPAPAQLTFDMGESPVREDFHELMNACPPLRDARSASVSLAVRWDDLRREAGLPRVEVGLDGMWFGTAEYVLADPVPVVIWRINPEYPRVPLDHEDYPGQPPNPTADTWPPPDPVAFEPDSAGTALPSYRTRPSYMVQMNESVGRLDALSTALLTHAFAGPCDAVRLCLSDIRYLGPLRRIPMRRPAVYRGDNDLPEWGDGSITWKILNDADDAFLSEVNRWLGVLRIGYEVRRYYYREVPEPLIEAAGRKPSARQLLKLFEASTTRRRTALIDRSTGLEMQPPDLGTGVSQIIPVVVAALAPGASVIAFEQPELHVHPAMQVGIADMFIHRAQTATLLVETHSEHLLLRVLRRVRETATQSLPPGGCAIQPDQVAVYWVDRHHPEPVRALTVDARGDFIGPWPSGFFDSRAEELFQ
jgi:hypothetical protein